MPDDAVGSGDSQNLATLWVSVVPTAEKVGPAMEKAGDEARHKFRDRFKEIGTDITDIFKKSGSDSGDKFNQELGAKTRDKSKEIGRNAGAEFGEAFGTEAGSAADKWADSLSDISGALDTLSDAAGIASPLFEKLGINAGTVPDALSGVSGAAQDVQGKFTSLKSGVSDTIGVLDALKTDSPSIISTLGSIGSAAVIAFAPFQLAASSIGSVQRALEKLGIAKGPEDGGRDWTHDFTHPWDLPFFKGQFWDNVIHGRGGMAEAPDDGGSAAPPNFYRDWYPQHTNVGAAGGMPSSPTAGFGPPVGSAGGFGLPTNPGGAGIGGAGAFPSFPAPPTELPPEEHNPGGKNGPGPGNSSPFAHMPAFKPVPEPKPESDDSGGGGARAGASGRGRVNVGGVSDRRGVAAAGSRIANLYALANALQGTPYSQELRNDCSGMVSQLAAVAAGLPDPSPGERFTTVNEGEELTKMGFLPGIGPSGSLRVGWYDHGGGNAGHTAMTLPGGEHAESGGSHGNFLVGPGAAGADNPEFDHHAWLPMNGTSPGVRGGGGGMRFGSPDGSQHDPFYVISAGASGSGGGKGGAGGAQGQQIGQDMFNGALGELGLDGSVFQGFDGSSVQSSSLGSVISGISQLMPGMNGGPMAKGAVAVGPGGAQNVRTGETTNNYFGDVAPFNITQHGVSGNGVTEFEQHKNAMAAGRGPALIANLPGK